MFSAAASDDEDFHSDMGRRLVLGLHLFPGPYDRVLLQAEIVAGDAVEAHLVLSEPNSFREPFHVIVAEPVDAYLIRYLLVQLRYGRVFAVDSVCQKLFACWEVDTHVARMPDWGERYDHVDFLGASVA